jgi:hypothetical protein
VGGAATVTGGLVLLVYAIVKVQTYGWDSARTLALGGAALALLAAFIAIELLRRRHTSQVDGQIAQRDVGQLDRSATATGATASSGVGPNRRATI